MKDMSPPDHFSPTPLSHRLEVTPKPNKFEAVHKPAISSAIGM
jgi:hypothetical protein